MRRGSGKPLLLVHGLGGSWRSWETIMDRLAGEREVIAVDLPGFGDTPPLPETSIATLADALESFMSEQGLEGVDMAGSSMGARLVLELARRGKGGAVVALDPGGFWSPAERRVFGASVWLSVRLVRLLRPLIGLLSSNPVTRTLLLAQFSAKPWALPSGVVDTELRSFVAARSFDSALHALVHGPTQEGAATTPGPVVLGWGRRDLVTLPRQAARAQARFPRARIEWYARCGHFPHWDRPDAAVQTILDATA